jgi:ribonuclease P protein component
LLPKKERIAKSKDIRKAIKGKKINTPLLNITLSPNTEENPRAVVICKKLIGNACVRNKTRRVIMAAYANIRHNIAKKMDIVFVPRRSIQSASQVAGEINQVLINGNN